MDDLRPPGWPPRPARRMPGGWVEPSELPRGGNGRALCRWCSLEVPAGRRTFCSDWCVHEWKLRSDPGYLREQVLARDRGVCAACGVDTLAEWIWIRKLRGAAQQRRIGEWGIRWGSRASLWDADHIIPVAEGGGECDLSNLRTLCLRCHRQSTTQLRRRLSQRRAGA